MAENPTLMTLNGAPLRWSDLNQAFVPTWPCSTRCDDDCDAECHEAHLLAREVLRLRDEKP